MTADQPVTVVKDMAVTHREFARAFARMVPDQVAAREPADDGAVRRFPWGGGVVEVYLAPETTRRLGMMAIPRTRIALTFTGLSLDDREEFIRQFDRRFQRGGG